MASIEWLAALDVENAVANLVREQVGDWYVDPWGWPEVAYLSRRGVEMLVDHLNSHEAGRVAQLDVPKENWGVRPAVVLDVLDRLAYQSLVDKLSHHLIGRLSPSVYGWRLPSRDPLAGRYSHQDIQWEAYRNHLAIGSSCYEYGLTTDVVSCFASISLDLANSAIDDSCPKGLPTRRLTSLLERIGALSPREGLPQRSTASAVLANRILTVFDDVLADHSTNITEPVDLKDKLNTRVRRSSLRWMDDMWLFADSEANLRRAQLDLQEAALTVGLHLGTAKTSVYVGDELREAALQIQHSAVDFALDVSNDKKPLEDLTDSLLGKGNTASRTSVKFAINRLLKTGSDYKVEEVLEISPRMPHVADAFAKFIAIKFVTESLEDWFVEQAGGGWWLFDWSVGQYLRMFGSDYQPSKLLIDWTAARLAEDNCNVQLMAACAQRLSSWAPEKARAAIRAGLARTNNPQSRRILSLAALNAGEPSRQVTRWLGQEAENRVTLAMLKDRSFSPPRIAGGYARAIH